MWDQLLTEKWVCHLTMVYQYASFCFQLFEHLAKRKKFFC